MEKKPESKETADRTGKPARPKRTLRDWLSLLPGTRSEYILLSLVAVDIVLLLLRNSYDTFLDRRISLGIFAFDLLIVGIWGLDFLRRLFKSDDRVNFVATNWYEVVGMIPIIVLRPFLLLRGVKLGIAFYKLGKSSDNLSRTLTREVTFKFRDIIVDTIADAVFLQSLQRVEEVMIRLDYAQLARRSFTNHEQELDKVVKNSLYSKSMMGELARVPFMGGFMDRIGGDVTSVISEVLEAKVTGEIMKEITRGILSEMTTTVQALDVERITSTPTGVREAVRGQFQESIRAAERNPDLTENITKN